MRTGRKVRIDSQGGKRAHKQRTAITELHIGAVELQPSQGRAESGAAWAERIVGWYEARWGIEDRRLRAADVLVKCLAFDAITAWRVFALDRYARDAPDTPVAEVLTEDEQEVIEEVVRKGRLLPPAERGKPSLADIRSWVLWLARMAGFTPLEAATPARERSALAGLRQDANHRVVQAIGTVSLRG